jgi:hypothetical protein
MNQTYTSISVWGVLMLVFGTSYLLFPNFFLPLFGMPPTFDGWIRVVGLLITILGGYYLYGARQQDLVFCRVTIPGRLAFAVGLAALAALGFLPKPVLILAAVDLFGALWTWQTMRLSQAKTASPGQ